MTNENDILELAKTLRLHAIQAHWHEIAKSDEQKALIRNLLLWENQERERRRLDACVRKNGIKAVSPMSGFDWTWPTKINREQIEDLFNLSFLTEHVNVVMIGSAGLGKTMIAQNLVDLASRKGHSALFVESSHLMGELVAETTRRGLESALAKYTKPKLLAIDELGYLAYDTRFADLLFQLIHRRTKNSSTIITTNRAFGEWREVFPNAASVTALIDRIIERCEVIQIEGESFRQKRFQERLQVKKTKKPGKAPTSQAQSKTDEPVLPK
jgi:DNA replication protein DnaC